MKLRIVIGCLAIWLASGMPLRAQSDYNKWRLDATGELAVPLGTFGDFNNLGGGAAMGLQRRIATDALAVGARVGLNYWNGGQGTGPDIGPVYSKRLNYRFKTFEMLATVEYRNSPTEKLELFGQLGVGAVYVRSLQTQTLALQATGEAIDSTSASSAHNGVFAALVPAFGVRYFPVQRLGIQLRIGFPLYFAGNESEKTADGRFVTERLGQPAAAFRLGLGLTYAFGKAGGS